MSTNFPGSLDNATSLPYPAALSTRTSPSLAGLQDNQNDAVIAAQTKLGIGASTPTNNNLLIGTGVGTSAWTKAAPTGTIVGTTDSQTLTNKSLTLPTITSPVITNAALTTDLIAGFTTATSGSIYGVPITLGVLQTANTVSGTTLTATSVAGSKLDFSTWATASLGGSVTSFGALKLRVGWSQILGTGTTSLTTTVTLPASFTAAYTVVCSSLGFKSGGTAATLIGDFNSAISGNQISISITGITTTQFTLSATTVSGSFGAAYHGFSWIAIGI
jgi:hypothetical protein